MGSHRPLVSVNTRLHVCDVMTLHYVITLHLDVTLLCDVMTLRLFAIHNDHRSFFPKRSGRIHRCLYRHQSVGSEEPELRNVTWENGTRDG